MFICFLHVVLDKHDHSVSQLFWKLKPFFFLMCYIATSYSNNIDFLDKGIYVLTKEEMVFSHPQIEKFQLVLASSGILKQLTPHHVPCGISSDQSSGGGKEGWTILWGEGRAYIISGPKERITHSLIQNKTHRDCGENRTADWWWSKSLWRWWGRSWWRQF